MRSSSFTVALVAFALSTMSCAKILGIEDTALLPLPEALSCVGEVVPPVGNGTQINIVAYIGNIATGGTPIANVRVRRCLSRLDLTCDGADVYLSGADGLVTVPVTSGFNGYLRIEDPNPALPADDPNRLVTYFWYFSQAIVDNRPEPFPIFAMTRAFREIALYDGVTEDTTLRGELAINSTDCADENIDGIRFEITTPTRVDELTLPFYFSDGLVLIDPPIAEQQTDAMSAIGGYRAVKSGTVGIRAIHAASGVTVAEDTLLVQPDVLTTVRLLPQ